MRAPATPPLNSDEVHTSVDIAAPPDAVFHAISDPHELAAWLGGHAAAMPAWAAPAFPIAGQPWRAAAIGPDGRPGWVSGEFLLVDPPRRLESTWRASWDDLSPDRVHFELVPITIGGGSGTRLTVTHTRAQAHLRVTASAGAPAHGEWTAILGRLSVYLTMPPAVRPPGDVDHPARGAWIGDVVVEVPARVLFRPGDQT